jgi:hypothetical protein
VLTCLLYDLKRGGSIAWGTSSCSVCETQRSRLCLHRKAIRLSQQYLHPAALMQFCSCSCTLSGAFLCICISALLTAYTNSDCSL